MVLIQINKYLPGKYCNNILATVLDKLSFGVQNSIIESQTPRRSFKKAQMPGTPFLALHLQELRYTDMRGANFSKGVTVMTQSPGGLTTPPCLH